MCPRTYFKTQIAAPFWSERVIMSNMGLHVSSLKHIISSMLATLLERDYMSPRRSRLICKGVWELWFFQKTTRFSYGMSTAWSTNTACGLLTSSFFSTILWVLDYCCPSRWLRIFLSPSCFLVSFSQTFTNKKVQPAPWATIPSTSPVWFWATEFIWR